MDSETRSLLRALFAINSRIAFKEFEVRAIVAPTKSQIKQIRAFNACNGSSTQGEIARRLKLDHGNFSRTVKRWTDLGIVHRIHVDGEDRLLHVFPISESSATQDRGEQ